MPQPSKGKRMGGSPAHERLILANLATALFEHGRITTTEARARRLRPVAERLITISKKCYDRWITRSLVQGFQRAQVQCLLLLSVDVTHGPQYVARGPQREMPRSAVRLRTECCELAAVVAHANT